MSSKALQLELLLQKAGVVLKDPKKWCKKNSQVMQMWELRVAEQRLLAINIVPELSK